jgi:uncharacterized protein (TIGR03435 family)
MKPAVIFLFLVPVAAAQTFSPGVPAPVITAPPLEAARPFPGWPAFRGNYVIIDFWATWCGPCIPGLDKLVNLEKQFSGERVRFLTVATDTMERVRKYYSEKSIPLQTFVADEDNPATTDAFGIHGIPAAAVIDPEGRLVAVTPGENITADALRKLLAGEKVGFPAFQRMNNITWDQEEIAWADGVLPSFQVVIKPLEVSGGGYMYKPGSNRISGDGASVQAMIQAAWRTDSNHIERHMELPSGAFRFAATVPKGRESELLPALQDALQRTFGFHALWEDRGREVFVLTRLESPAPTPSTAKPLFQFLRGKITMRAQTVATLAETLPNWLRKPVVDETGLAGLYDFDLEYRDDGPQVLTTGLRDKYGIVLSPARRTVRMLVIGK